MLDVLHVLHTFPPQTQGGVQAYVERIARGQSERGARVAVACATSGAGGAAGDPQSGAAHHSTWNGIDVYRVRALSPFEQLDELARPTAATQRWRDLVAELAPAAVHVHHQQGVPLDLLATARERGARTALTLHDFHTTCALFFRLREERELCAPDVPIATCAQCVARAHGVDEARLLALLPHRVTAFERELVRADVLLCASRAQAEYWSRIPGCGERVPLVLPLPRAHGRAEVPAPPNDGVLQVATWGGLVRGKGLLVLLDALRELPAGSVHVHHHGPHLDTAFLAEVRAHPAAPALELHGPFTSDELAAVARRYHLAVFPSLFLETHGLAVDEALDLGLPVVVSDRGAPQERIGTRGTTFRVGDPRELARVLRSVVDDRGHLERWRDGARADQPSLAEHLDALDAVYMLQTRGR